MVVQVGPEAYAAVRPFFAEVIFDMFVTAVLAGELPGRVFVDSLTRPTSGFIMTAESSYAVGSPENRPFLRALRRVFEQTILLGDVVNPANSEFAVGFVSGAWDGAIRELMDGWHARTEDDGETCHYLLKPEALQPQPVPVGYSVKKIAHSDLHRQAMTMWAEAFDLAQLNTSTDYERFQRTGFGYVALYYGRVVAACLTDVVSGGRCEVGIVTDAAHRRRGLAAAVTAALCTDAFATGFREVNWQTGDDNIGSRKTAEKVGFALNLLYQTRYFEPGDVYG